MVKKLCLSVLLNALLVSILANSYFLIEQSALWLMFYIPVFLIVCIFAGTLIPQRGDRRLLVCQHGTVLLYAFCISVILSVFYHLMLAFTIPLRQLFWSIVVCVGVNGAVFWVGIACVYATSGQLGLKLRIIGIVCAWIPLLNFWVLSYTLAKATEEYLFEIAKLHYNEARKHQKVCATKYPILLVHGVFFRDFKHINYWGRIPKELKNNGAVIFYGNHGSAASIADSAEELAARIEEIIQQTGAEKLNIIAHSKGGLDCRYAIAKLGIGNRVASLTTINTPHRGCLFADYLLDRISDNIKNKVANTYNQALRKLGEAKPDFLAAVNDLTDSHCKELDAQMPAPEGIFCQSVGSIMTKATYGKFPMSLSYHIVKFFDRQSDGIVGEDAFSWGEKYTLLRPQGDRGISHCDMIDLNRENIRGFDVREFYVGLVHDLKERGL